MKKFPYLLSASLFSSLSLAMTAEVTLQRSGASGTTIVPVLQSITKKDNVFRQRLWGVVTNPSAAGAVELQPVLFSTIETPTVGSRFTASSSGTTVDVDLTEYTGLFPTLSTLACSSQVMTCLFRIQQAIKGGDTDCASASGGSGGYTTCLYNRQTQLGTTCGGTDTSDSFPSANEESHSATGGYTICAAQDEQTYNFLGSQFRGIL